MKILSNKEYQGYLNTFEANKEELEELRLIKQKYKLIQKDLEENGIKYRFIEHRSGRDFQGIWDYDVYMVERGINLAKVLKDIAEYDLENKEQDTVNVEVNITVDGKTVYKTLKEIRKESK